MNCINCKDFTCPHRLESTGGGSCYYESGEQKEKLLTMAAEASLHYADWSSFRREAAREILAGLCANFNRGFSGRITDAPDLAIELANSLIEKLKQE